jgi:hypothetical protein
MTSSLYGKGEPSGPGWPQDLRPVLASLPGPLHVIQDNECIGTGEKLEVSEPGQVMGLLADQSHSKRLVPSAADGKSPLA